MTEEENYTVQLISKCGSAQQGIFTLTETEESYSVKLVFGNQKLSAEDRDYFEALCRIREQLEPLELQPYCYGASRNVFPSGMARDMSGAWRAYKLTLGEKGKIANLVDIFESGSNLDIVSVTEQAAFYNKWLRSVGFPMQPN